MRRLTVYFFMCPIHTSRDCRCRQCPWGIPPNTFMIRTLYTYGKKLHLFVAWSFESQQDCCNDMKSSQPCNIRLFDYIMFALGVKGRNSVQSKCLRYNLKQQWKIENIESDLSWLTCTDDAFTLALQHITEIFINTFHSSRLPSRKLF